MPAAFTIRRSTSPCSLCSPAALTRGVRSPEPVSLRDLPGHDHQPARTREQLAICPRDCGMARCLDPFWRRSCMEGPVPGRGQEVAHGQSSCPEPRAFARLPRSDEGTHLWQRCLHPQRHEWKRGLRHRGRPVADPKPGGHGGRSGEAQESIATLDRMTRDDSRPAEWRGLVPRDLLRIRLLIPGFRKRRSFCPGKQDPPARHDSNADSLVGG